MQLIDHNGAGPHARDSIVTIGNFDGVHLGHRALIDRCLALSENDRTTALVTFSPLPQAWFRPDLAPARLTGDRVKAELIFEAGMDLVWAMRFNRELAEMPAPRFVQHVLCGGLGAAAVVVGSDFRFGRDREGDVDLLRRIGAAEGFAVEVVPDLLVEGQRVSSSAIREALASGDLRLAERLLGRRYTLRGEVAKGLGLGRKLGFPTANFVPEELPSPVAGVFAVECRTGQGPWRPGVANAGTRPAVGGTGFLVEVNVFDFDGTLYGEILEVAFVERLRAERHFDSLEEMIPQMKADARRAREILGLHQQG